MCGLHYRAIVHTWHSGNLCFSLCSIVLVNLCTGLTEECIIEQGCGSTKLLLLQDLYSGITNSRQDVALLTHDP